MPDPTLTPLEIAVLDRLATSRELEHSPRISSCYEYLQGRGFTGTGMYGNRMFITDAGREALAEIQRGDPS